MRNLFKIVVLSFTLAQAGSVLAQITVPSKDVSLTLRHFTSDSINYIGLQIKLPTSPDRVIPFTPPSCLTDNIVGLEYFGTRIEKGKLRVWVFGLVSDDRQRFCGDFTQTSFSEFVNQINDGSINVKVEPLSAINSKKIVVTKTAKTSTNTWTENVTVYVRGSRIWMFGVSYPESDISTKKLATEIMSSVKIENEKP